MVFGRHPVCSGGRAPSVRPQGYIAILRGDDVEEPPPAANAGPLAPVLAGLLKVDPNERLTAESATAMLRIASLAPWAPETSPETAARMAEAVRRQQEREKLSAVDHFRAVPKSSAPTCRNRSATSPMPCNGTVQSR